MPLKVLKTRAMPVGIDLGDGIEPDDELDLRQAQPEWAVAAELSLGATEEARAV